MADRDYLIEIILRARDEIAGTVAKATGELEGLKKAADNSSFKNLDKDAERLSNTLRTKLHTELDKVRGDLNQAGGEAEKFERKMAALQKRADESNRALKNIDLDGVGRKLRRAEADAEKAGNELERLGKRTKKNQQEWDRWSGTLDKANERINAHSGVLRRAQGEMANLGKVTEALNKTEIDHQRTLERTQRAYQKQIDAVVKLRDARRRIETDPVASRDFDFASLDREIDRERKKLGTLAAEVEALSLQKVRIGVDLDSGGFTAGVGKVESEKAALGSDVHIDVDLDVAAAEAKLAAFDATKRRAGSMPGGGGGGFLGWVRQVGHEAENSRSSIAAFDNSLRGMMVLSVIATAQQLLTILVALGAELIAVSSSAIMAGGALGGALVAGIAQALPMVGLLVAAFARFGSVLEAVKQQELVQQQQSAETGKAAKGAASAANSLANANDALKSAIEGVAGAKQNLILAEINLTRARFESRRELEDLILKEREAALAAKGASLSHFESRQALQAAIREGRVSDVASAQLDVESSSIGADSARIEAQRAREDLNFQRSGSELRPNTGVADAERQIEQARKSLEQARRAVDQARRGIEQAKASAAEAGADTLASANKFNYMLSQLSNAEKRLYKGLLRLKETYKEVFRPITDIIINSFTYAVNKIDDLLRKPKFIAGFKDLATSMANNFKRVTDVFTSPTWVNFFTTMTKEAARNIGPLTDAFLSIANAFRRIALAAAPVLRDIVGWIDEGAEAFEDWVGGGKELRAFFREGEKHLEAWGKLTMSILKLFLALIGASSGEGLSTVKSLTGEIDKATSYINNNRKEVEGFFQEVGDVMSVLGEVVLALGKEIIRSFDPESVEALGDIVMRILIPALGEAIRLFGRIFIFVDKLTQNDLVATVLKWGLGFMIAKKVIDPFVGMIQTLLISMRSLGMIFAGSIARLAGVPAAVIAAQGPMAALATALSGVSLAAIAIPAAIAAAIGAFIFLSAKFGVLDDQVDAVKDSFSGFIRPIVKPLNEIIDQVEELAGALGVLGGEGEGLGKIFKFVFVAIVKGAVIPTIKFFGSQLEFVGSVIGGMLEMVSGALDILIGVLTLDFDRIVDGAKKMALGFTAPFRFMFNRALNLVKDGVDLIRKPIGAMVAWVGNRISDLPGVASRGFSGLISLFSKLGGRVLRGLSSGFSTVWDWLRRLPNRFVQGGEDIAKALARGIGKLPGLLSKALSGAGSIVKDLAESLMEFINDETPFGDSIDLGLTSISIPKLPEHFERGGPIGGGFGGGDRIPIVAEEGEHMWTKDEVRNAGGHGAMYAMRAFFGGGGQSRGRGFAEGGAPIASAPEAQKQGEPTEQTVGMGLDALLNLLRSFGKEAVDLWNSIWGDIEKRTESGANVVDRRFDDLRHSMIASSNRIEVQVGNSFDALVGDIRGSIGQATSVVFQGMQYILETTNKALKAFGASEVSLSLSKPNGGGGKSKAERKAGGGFIGRMGERGADAIATWLGRGEAVLNWGHQKIVDPALRKVYGFGLGDMFDRTQSEHAGGGMPGFSGGYAGQTPSGNTSVPIPGFPGEFVAQQVLDEAMQLIKQFRLFVTDAFATSGHSGAGHLFSGTAIDVVPGSGGSWDLVDKAVAYARSKGMTVLYDGVEGHGRGHHAHIELEDGAIKGVVGGIAKAIAKLKVKGDEGGLKSIAEGALEKVRKAANKKIGKEAMLDNASYALGDLDIQGSVAAVFAKVAKMLNAPFRATLALFEAGLAESGLQDLSYGHSSSEGSLQLLSSTASSLGIDPHDEDAVASHFLQKGYWKGIGAINLAKTTDLPAHMIAQTVQGSAFYDGSNYLAQKDAALAVMRKFGFRMPKGFATGGVVGEEGGVGRQIPILAHLGEWILNPRQQLGLAKMLGTSVDKLKGMLGFSGGPTSFAGGGEPKDQGKTSKTKEKIGIEDAWDLTGNLIPNLESFQSALKFYTEVIGKGLHEGVKEFRKKGADLSKIYTRLFTANNIQLEGMKEAFENVMTKMSTALAKATVKVNRKGQVIGRQFQPDRLLLLELDQMRRALNYLLGEQGMINRSLRVAQKALRKAQGEGDKEATQKAKAAVVNLKNKKREIESEVAEQQVAILEKMEAALQAQVQAINDQAEKELTGIGGVSTRQRVLSAMGFSAQANALAKQQISVMQNQQNALQGALHTALAQGNNELAGQIESQIADLSGQIVEATASLIANAEQEIEKAAERQRFGLEIANRMADVQEKYGNIRGAQVARGQVLSRETGVISSQLSATRSLLAEAVAQGFGPDVIEPLEEKVGDLTQQLEENAASIYENTIAIRQASIDSISNRQGFLGGISDQLIELVNIIGTIAGQVNQPRLIGLMESALTQLSATGKELRAQLTGFVGESAGKLSGQAAGALKTLEGLHGEELVAAVGKLNLTEIVNSLGAESPLAKQFESLIQAILENEIAIQQNTDQLKQAKQQSEIQSFTSTAWQWFRKAIFTGMGGLMPQYAEGTPFYQAASGAEVMSDGPVEVHRGEIIIPPNFSSFLRRLVGAQAMAAGMGSGTMPGAPLGIDFASQRASTIQAQLAAAARGGSTAAELSRLRAELAARSQEINVNVEKGEPTEDVNYLAGRLAFAVRTPST